mmetsp:Transcript_16763/g.36028  ORF Transcript_16763/g.36028 Transcript_16763/m.36028 type:complete len:288 (+) Transcript_16763:839-1702(+)
MRQAHHLAAIFLREALDVGTLGEIPADDEVVRLLDSTVTKATGDGSTEARKGVEAEVDDVVQNAQEKCQTLTDWPHEDLLQGQQDGLLDSSGLLATMAGSRVMASVAAIEVARPLSPQPYGPQVLDLILCDHFLQLVCMGLELRIARSSLDEDITEILAGLLSQFGEHGLLHSRVTLELQFALLFVGQTILPALDFWVVAHVGIFRLTTGHLATIGFATSDFAKAVRGLGGHAHGVARRQEPEWVLGFHLSCAVEVAFVGHQSTLAVRVLLTLQQLASALLLPAHGS